MRQGFTMFLHPEDQDKTTQALLSLANNPETNERFCVLENRYFSADGRTIYTKQHIQGYYDEAGSLFLVIVLTEDITAAQQLRLSNQSVISKLKEVHSQLKEFNDLLPDSKKFLSVKSLSDYGFSSMEKKIAAMIYNGHTNKKIAQAVLHFREYGQASYNEHILQMQSQKPYRLHQLDTDKPHCHLTTVCPPVPFQPRAPWCLKNSPWCYC